MVSGMACLELGGVGKYRGIVEEEGYQATHSEAGGNKALGIGSGHTKEGS